jgi:ACR3 family arsenite efflux pump ArsB
VNISNQSQESKDSWQEKFITLVEASSNVAFYTIAMIVLIAPPLKSISDFFESNDSGWWVLGAAIFFAIVLPVLADVVTKPAMGFLHRIRTGEFLPVVFRPLKSVFAVAAIYGVLKLEYELMHSDTEWSILKILLASLSALV